MEACGGVLFINKVYRLFPSARKGFNRETTEELMAVVEQGDPIMIFAHYPKQMPIFLMYTQDYDHLFIKNLSFWIIQLQNLGRLSRRKPNKKVSTSAKLMFLKFLHYTLQNEQRENMNTCLVQILLQESIEEASNRLPPRCLIEDRGPMHAFTIVHRLGGI